MQACLLRQTVLIIRLIIYLKDFMLSDRLTANCEIVYINSIADQIWSFDVIFNS
jgi:hypothetical protein